MSNLAYQDEVLIEMLEGKTVAMSPSPAVNHNIAIVNIIQIKEKRRGEMRCGNR